MFDAIGFDADDILWHNERLFSMTQEKLRGILKEHASDLVDRTLYVTERKNLQMFGYGIKGFVLSMIETYIQLTNGDITGKEIEQIMDFGREMLGAPIQLLENVESIFQQLNKGAFTFSNNHKVISLIRRPKSHVLACMNILMGLKSSQKRMRRPIIKFWLNIKSSPTIF